MSFERLTAGFAARESRCLAQLISLAENADERLMPFLQGMSARLGRSQRIGLSGPPGAGKSTLVGELIRRIRARGQTVAVLAVDPVSPFSGGALLGDRIRLTEFFGDEGVFIRSLSTRGALGGLSQASYLSADLCDAFGFDVLLIETVGVGQSEVEIRNLVDEVVLVLVPEWGDSIQAIKAGILEIGDLFVVNKADREGAERVVQELKTLMTLAGKDLGTVFSTSSQDKPSLDHFFESVFAWLSAHPKSWNERRRARGGRVLEGWIKAALWKEFLHAFPQDPSQVVDPYQGFTEFRSRFAPGFLNKGKA